MNQKTLKNFRRAIREMGAHLPVRSLVTPMRQVEVPDFSRPIKLDGTQHMRLMDFPMPAFNARGTQRAGYRAAKAVARQG